MCACLPVFIKPGHCSSCRCSLVSQAQGVCVSVFLCVCVCVCAPVCHQDVGGKTGEKEDDPFKGEAYRVRWSTFIFSLTS